ncbi:MAG: hypothetical protein ACFCUQ_18125 [Kiloniellales bacterium]
MRLGDDIDLGCGITGKVIGRTFEQDTRVDLLTPWGVLNGVRLSALLNGLALNPERQDVSAHDTGRKGEQGETVDLETPWGRLRAVPVTVLACHAERRREAPPQSNASAEIESLTAQTAIATAVGDILQPRARAGAGAVPLGRWPRRVQPGAGRRVA